MMAAAGALRSVTFAMIKPELFAHAGRLAQVRQRIAEEGFTVLAERNLVLPSSAAEQFYAEHEGKFFHPRLLASIQSGPLQALLLGRADTAAVVHWRALIGPTHCLRAQTQAPRSLRAQFAISDTRNGFHGADSPAAVVREASIVGLWQDYATSLVDES